MKHVHKVLSYYARRQQSHTKKTIPIPPTKHDQILNLAIIHNLSSNLIRAKKLWDWVWVFELPGFSFILKLPWNKHDKRPHCHLPSGMSLNNVQQTRFDVFEGEPIRILKRLEA
jgi:hypothetical protein